MTFATTTARNALEARQAAAKARRAGLRLAAIKRKLEILRECECMCLEVRNGKHWALVVPRLHATGKFYEVHEWGQVEESTGRPPRTYRMGSSLGLPCIKRAVRRALLLQD